MWHKRLLRIFWVQQSSSQSCALIVKAMQQQTFEVHTVPHMFKHTCAAILISIPRISLLRVRYGVWLPFKESFLRNPPQACRPRHSTDNSPYHPKTAVPSTSCHPQQTPQCVSVKFFRFRF